MHQCMLYVLVYIRTIHILQYMYVRTCSVCVFMSVHCCHDMEIRCAEGVHCVYMGMCACVNV